MASTGPLGQQAEAEAEPEAEEAPEPEETETLHNYFIVIMGGILS